MPPPLPPASDPAARRSFVLRLIAITVLGCTLVALLATGVAPSPSEVSDWGDDLGPWAAWIWPFVFTGINLLLPWPAAAGATGLVFGTALGTFLSMVGVLLATAVQFLAARYLLGDRIRHAILGRFPAVDDLLERNDVIATFYSRLVPGIPWGVVNYASGLARVRLWALLLATLTAGAPKVFAYTALGGSLDDLGAPEAKIAIALLLVMGIAGAFMARRRLRAERV